jgi:molybdate transport repressor ModE-like protein
VRYDLVDLKLFLNIAEAGSVTAAAERSNLALASASARLKSMEEALGAALVERHRRGVVLTAAGYTLLHHARTISNQIAVMNGELGAHANGLRARVRLLVNTAANGRITTLLGSFLSKNPAIDVDIEEMPSYRIAEMIANGVGDIGIAAHGEGLSPLETRRFQDDRLVVIDGRRPGHLERVRSVDLQQVMNSPFVGLPVGNALQEHLIRHAARLGGHINFRVRVPTLAAVCELVSDGVGIAVVPQFDAQSSAVAKTLKIVALRNDWAKRELKLCARRFVELSPQAALLADILSETRTS